MLVLRATLGPYAAGQALNIMKNILITVSKVVSWFVDLHGILTQGGH